MPTGRVIVSVTNDLVSDQRVHKVCQSLTSFGYEVLLVGRILEGSAEINRSYHTKRFHLIFNKGMLFYAEYNIRLFLFLLFSRFDIAHANDLDTLAANYLASAMRRKKLVYDSHEYFTEVPELAGRKLKKAIWKSIEAFIFPRLKNVITVNSSIAELYRKEYGVNVEVMRNIPVISDSLRIESVRKSRSELGLPDGPLLILQGAWINVDRGGEEAILAMKYLQGFNLLVVGGGDVYNDLRKIAEEVKESRIIFKPRLPFEELRHFTMNADLGLSLDKGTNLNYYYSLPNKVFDYIHSGVPVLASSMPEVAKIVTTYKVGEITTSHDPADLAAQIKRMFEDAGKLQEYKRNCMKHRAQLSWEQESQVLKKFY